MATYRSMFQIGLLFVTLSACANFVEREHMTAGAESSVDARSSLLSVWSSVASAEPAPLQTARYVGFGVLWLAATALLVPYALRLGRDEGLVPGQV